MRFRSQVTWGPHHPFSNLRRIPQRSQLPHFRTSQLPTDPGFSAGYPSSSFPASPPATTRPGPYRGWAYLANARLLSNGPDFRDVAKRVSELGPARLEHRALGRR